MTCFLVCYEVTRRLAGRQIQRVSPVGTMISQSPVVFLPTITTEARKSRLAHRGDVRDRKTLAAQQQIIGQHGTMILQMVLWRTIQLVQPTI